MKYCEYCGSEAQNYYSNCRSCGAPFSIKTVYSQDKNPGRKPSTVAYNEELFLDLLPIFVSMAIFSYVVDKIGNLFRFKKQKVVGIESSKYTYTRRRGYL